jgi:hypothetical protein
MNIPYGRIVLEQKRQVADVKQSRAYCFLIIIFGFGVILSGVFTLAVAFIASFLKPDMWSLFDHGVWAFVICLILTRAVYFFRRKPIPQFFIYEGSCMKLDIELLDRLTEKDVAHLSEVERKFFKWYKTSKVVEVSSCSCMGRVSQEEMCYMMLNILEEIRTNDKTGKPVIELSKFF